MRSSVGLPAKSVRPCSTGGIEQEGEPTRLSRLRARSQRIDGGAGDRHPEDVEIHIAFCC